MERSGREPFLLHDYDVAPISLISWQTIMQIARVDLEGGAAFDEPNWVGRIIVCGRQRESLLQKSTIVCRYEHK